MQLQTPYVSLMLECCSLCLQVLLEAIVACLLAAQRELIRSWMTRLCSQRACCSPAGVCFNVAQVMIAE
jgi:hypothetical protein